MSDADFGFPSEFPYEYGPSSPSSESSDGEEDFFAGLTRRLPLSEARVPVGSPQSTLAGIGSPNTKPFHQSNDPWDVIYAAAGQVARLKINNNNNNNNAPFLTLPHTRTFNQVEEVKVKVNPSVWGRRVEAKGSVLVEKRAREFRYESVKCTRPLCLPQSAWPPLQHCNRVQFSGSGSRVVPAVKRGCAGTGVFLPRHYETPSEPRKRTGSAPVLLPAKVVHALNLNVEELNGTGHQRFFTDYDAVLARRNALLMQQRLTLLRREEAATHEVRLPQEWTY
ncbi:hypothetical protein Fmac_014526 [Flemingia macrophylla]|uniref:Uncharacterized protein n=1 Tax=Flemingia macrophylla TaxID=520843 RepID=A0ABD1MBZ9_9FABA